MFRQRLKHITQQQHLPEMNNLPEIPAKCEVDQELERRVEDNAELGCAVDGGGDGVKEDVAEPDVEREGVGGVEQTVDSQDDARIEHLQVLGHRQGAADALLLVESHPA